MDGKAWKLIPRDDLHLQNLEVQCKMNVISQDPNCTMLFGAAERMFISYNHSRVGNSLASQAEGCFKTHVTIILTSTKRRENDCNSPEPGVNLDKEAKKEKALNEIIVIILPFEISRKAPNI